MLAQYWRINKATGIHLHLASDGKPVVALCSLALDKDKLDFMQKIPLLDDPENFSRSNISPKAAALLITGKGVLIRQVEKLGVIDQSNFSGILTNADINDFYVQNFVSGERSYLAMIRKSEADKWIALFAGKGYDLLQLSLGPFAAEHILSQLNIYDGSYTFSGHMIQRGEDNVWLSYNYAAGTPSPFFIKAEDEPLEETLILAYAAAFQLVLSEQLYSISANSAELESRLRGKLLENKFRVKFALMLGVAFLVLFINFFVFFSLNEANEQLAVQVGRTTQNSTDAENINDAISQKEMLLKELGWGQLTNKTILIDQLAQLLPPEVSWESASIDPPDALALKTQRTVRFTSMRMVVTGKSASIIPVNEWVARAKSRHWVKNIQLDAYLFDNDAQTGKFTVTIDY
ncbi:hypothetical protein A0256_20860 [Mucilaginibacter sp. PAMC 26640]|nr:hypothetical protein A0256_20860 [Mucilaginibacter sp. PAMC 26640]